IDYEGNRGDARLERVAGLADALIDHPAVAIAARLATSRVWYLNRLARIREGEPPGEPFPVPARTESPPPRITKGRFVPEGRPSGPRFGATYNEERQRRGHRSTGRSGLAALALNSPARHIRMRSASKRSNVYGMAFVTMLAFGLGAGRAEAQWGLGM